MATKVISTRIKNKVDSYSAWQGSSAVLLNGEIAIVRVATGDTYVNPVTGKKEPVVELLMKVGDGSSTFDNLPWLSAKASDVYNWAKSSTIEEVPVTINVNDVSTTSTIGDWLKAINDSAASNATNISSVAEKVDVEKVSTAILSAVNALSSTSTGTGNFVKAVSQTDGKVSVTMGNIDESDLPTIATAKILVSEGLTLDTKLTNIDTALAGLKEQQGGHTDDQINTLIDSKLNTLDVSAPETSGEEISFIDTVSQTDGKISATKKTIPASTTATAGIVKLGSEGGAATYESVSALTTRVGAAETEVTNLKTAIAGGVHFKGTVSEIPTSETIILDGAEYTAIAGDTVLCEGKEFIYTGSMWEELGDVTRLGDLETKVNSLDYEGGDFGTSKFVTKVTQSDGLVTVEYAQPISGDIAHNSTTVKATLEDHETRIANVESSASGNASAIVTEAINALDVSEPIADGTSTSFIATAKQEDGKIVVTKANLPTATTDSVGIVKLGATGGAATYERVEAINTSIETSIEGVATRVTSVEEKLDGVTSVATSISEAINALDFAEPEASGETTAFIDTISQVDGKITATKKTISKATTLTPGIVQLCSNEEATTETEAATPKAVKTVNDKAVDAQTRVSNIESNYIRFDNDKLYIGKDGIEEIVFDCGGALI